MKNKMKNQHWETEKIIIKLMTDLERKKICYKTSEDRLK